MLNVLFCGYRDWALSIIAVIKRNPKINCLGVISSKEEYDQKIPQLTNETDFILFLGWSWIIPESITTRFLCLGLHPSDLPMFRGGSPLQHQIIKGVKNSKVTLMTLSSQKLDSGNIWAKENLSLEGDNMASVFNNIIVSSIKLLEKFILDFQQIESKTQNVSSGTYYKRRKPEESRLFLDDFNGKPLEELFNFIRALTDPYPNAYIEDEFGNRLLFKEVKFIPNN